MRSASRRCRRTSSVSFSFRRISAARFFSLAAQAIFTASSVRRFASSAKRRFFKAFSFSSATTLSRFALFLAAASAFLACFAFSFSAFIRAFLARSFSPCFALIASFIFLKRAFFSFNVSIAGADTNGTMINMHL